MTEENRPDARRNGKKRKAFFIAGTIILIALAGVLSYRSYTRAYLTTDDAFVEGAVHMVSARVAGHIAEILVTDNQSVQSGQTLARLDPETLQKDLAEAQASHQAELGRLAELKAQVTAQERRVAAARASLAGTKSAGEELKAAVLARAAEARAKQAALDQARLDLARAEKLSGQEVIPVSRYERAKTSFDMAASALTAAREQKNQAQVALDSHDSTVAQARARMRAEEAGLEMVRASLKTQASQIERRQAQVELARLRLAYTTVTAPSGGSIARMSVEVGNAVQVGQPIFSLINLEDAYVVANYKENRIELIRPGQKASLKIDAYSGRKFKGTVDSIMSGTGSAFTLFPPENASGNYVKVVQRVPVKITFDDPGEVRDLLRVGMSVVPTIHTK
ncbi:MAG: HlyD family secretion protein [bacterium]|nr:HlyD family secretion protein [bacterium]